MLSSGSPISPTGRLAGGDSAAADAQPRHRENFGEMEFWFAMIKIVAIVSLMSSAWSWWRCTFSHRPVWKRLRAFVE